MGAETALVHTCRERGLTNIDNRVYSTVEVNGEVTDNLVTARCFDSLT